MNSNDKHWELTRLKESKKKTSGGEILFHVILVILSAGLWLIPMGLYFGFRSLHNQSVDKKIKKLVKEK